MDLVKYVDEFMVIVKRDIPQHDPSKGLLLNIVDFDRERLNIIVRDKCPVPSTEQPGCL
jgi:hypothetical protein